jgi:hypothetical protein
LVTPPRGQSFGVLLGRISVLLGVLVLICVPGLTRVGQRLETSSRAPSFARNIECPPKKVTVAPVATVALPVPLATLTPVLAVRLASIPDALFPSSPHLHEPRPLRAPPVPFFA